MSRGSVSQMAFVIGARALRQLSLTRFACAHVSSVWLSHAAALGAVHGAWTGIVEAIWSSCRNALAKSTAIVAPMLTNDAWLLLLKRPRWPSKTLTVSPLS